MGNFNKADSPVSLLKKERQEAQPFQGLIENEGHVYSNWGLSRSTRPETKPFGLYSGGPGVSFSFDPFCSNPDDPQWQQVLQEYNRLALHGLGANASPIQTQWLQPGEVRIPAKLARPRFTTRYYEQFLE